MLILIDGNAMGHAHHHANTLNYAGMQTQAVYGFTRMLRDIKYSQPQDEMLVLWDGRAQFRYDLYAGYKGNRDVSDDPKKQAKKLAYRAQVPYIKAVTKALGVKQVLSPELEADDLAGYFVKQMENKKPVLLVTGDHDWMQLVRHDVQWLDPRGEGKKVRFDDFLDATGYHSPEEFLHGKCLHGDGSDTIPGVGGIGKDGAPKFLAQWRSVYNYFDAVDKGTFKPRLKYEKGLASPEGRFLFERNMELMNLRDARAPNKMAIQVMRDACKPELARAACERLGFLSILNQWDDWIKPFVSKTEEVTA